MDNNEDNDMSGEGLLVSSNHQVIKQITKLAVSQGMSYSKIGLIIPKCLQRIEAGEQLERVVLEEIISSKR